MSKVNVYQTRPWAVPYHAKDKRLAGPLVFVDAVRSRAESLQEAEIRLAIAFGGGRAYVAALGTVHNVP